MGSDPAMLLLIDNYDSFTYNLVHCLGEQGAATLVYRNDALTVSDVLALHPNGIVISPGPCNPDRAGICLSLISEAAGRIPILGICLGHQAISQAFGAKIIRAPKPVHGKLSAIYHCKNGVLAGIPSPFHATRYHSLIVDRATLPDCLEVTARTRDGLIMALSHKALPIHGVQFHPESIATEYGHVLLNNFITLTRQGNLVRRKG
jgi:anthranilate synthase component 2